MLNALRRMLGYRVSIGQLIAVAFVLVADVCMT